MNASSQFVVATHIMAMLAVKRLYLPDHDSTNSDEIADSVNNNAVVIRRILSKLREAGLVISKTGPHGGSVIAKDPRVITLEHIYKAVKEEGSIFHMHYSEPNPYCLIGGNIQNCLGDTFKEIEKSLSGILSGITLFDVVQKLLNQAGISTDHPKKLSRKN